MTEEYNTINNDNVYVVGNQNKSQVIFNWNEIEIGDTIIYVGHPRKMILRVKKIIDSNSTSSFVREKPCVEKSLDTVEMVDQNEGEIFLRNVTYIKSSTLYWLQKK